jgi:hypothetical protein
MYIISETKPSQTTKTSKRTSRQGRDRKTSETNCGIFGSSD